MNAVQIKTSIEDNKIIKQHKKEIKKMYNRYFDDYLDKNILPHVDVEDLVVYEHI